MRRLGLILLLGAVAAAAIWALQGGGADDLRRAAAAAQRDFQNGMARALRALRGAEPGAVAALMALCFGYGFAHAVGPGHGKVVIGAWGVSRRVGLARISAITLAAAMAQASTAVLVVGLGVLVLGLGRVALVDLAEVSLVMLSHAALGLIGAYLLWRGWRHRTGLLLAPAGIVGPTPASIVGPAPALALAPATAGMGEPTGTHGHGVAHVAHATDDLNDDACRSCGHSHAPDPSAAARAGSLGEALALVAAVAVRPCTGALLLLLIAWRMDVLAAGVAGVYAMGLGTAAFTLLVAWGSVGLREGTLAGLGGARQLARALPLVEMAAGAGLVVMALVLLSGG
ncbi:MAG: hypothetical protein JJU40_07700 [Rhodobacteraceae bacterium]|nr:hypothetical protein [Paracoccaceae bacterium]